MFAGGSWTPFHRLLLISSTIPSFIYETNNKQLFLIIRQGPTKNTQLQLNNCLVNHTISIHLRFNSTNIINYNISSINSIIKQNRHHQGINIPNTCLR